MLERESEYAKDTRWGVGTLLALSSAIFSLFNCKTATLYDRVFEIKLCAREREGGWREEELLLTCCFDKESSMDI